MLENLKDFKSAVLSACIGIYSLQRQFFVTDVWLTFIWKMKEDCPCGLQNLQVNCTLKRKTVTKFG